MWGAPGTGEEGGLSKAGEDVRGEWGATGCRRGGGEIGEGLLRFCGELGAEERRERLEYGGTGVDVSARGLRCW